MHIFFLTLVSITIFFLGGSFYFLYIQNDLLLHFYCGLIATVSALVTHCWVFFYFIGTGEGIREGVLANKLDLINIKKTKKFKGKTFPFALFSMIFLIVATILGAGVQTQKVALGWHMGLVYFAIAFNFFSFYQEYNVIRANQKLMTELNQEIESM